MMMMKENLNEQTYGIQSRDYKCPCGKAYLSYPALFTHIKHKHNGKAPGNVEKPSQSNKPRGRPALLARNSNISSRTNDSLKDNKTKSMKQKNRNKMYWQQFSRIFVFLSYIEDPQYINEHVWETLDAFKNFENFIDQRQFQNSLFFKICLGNSLSEFLKSVSISTQNWRFEQILLLFISLLEYIKEENSFRNIITQSPVDIMVQYINPFMSNYLQKFVESYELKHLWIMQKQNSNKIFQCFYSWLKWKEYTNFCITLID